MMENNEESECMNEEMETDCTSTDETHFIRMKVVKSIAEKESEVLSLIILNQENVIAMENISEQGKDNNVSSKSNEQRLVNDENMTGENESEKKIAGDAENTSVVLAPTPVVNEHKEPTSDDAKDVIYEDETDANENTTFQFHAADLAWMTLLDKFQVIPDNEKIRGYVDGEKGFLCLWETFQSSTMSTFSVRSSDRFYKEASDVEEGTVNGRILKGAAKWSRKPLVPFDGVPFVMMDRKYFGCRLGGCERRNRKKGQFKTTRNGQSMKVGCPADAEVLEVWRVPDLLLRECKSKRELRRVKHELLSKVYDYILMDKYTRRYYVTLPLITNHRNHAILDPQAGQYKLLHPKVIEKIYEFVNQGIFEKKVIKFMLEEFVQEFQKELGIEIQASDRSFYPTDRDIGNHVRNARNASKKVDLVTIAEVADDSAVSGNCTDETLTYTTEIASNSSFTGIITPTCEITYDVSTTETTNLYENTTVSVAEYENETVVDSSSYDTGSVEPRSYLETTDVNTVSIEDIVQNPDVLEYYQNGGAVTAEVDKTVRLLLSPMKRKSKKRQRKLPIKTAKTARKETDLKTLLRGEIHKSFAVINEALTEEHDEIVLKNVLKKTKALQRVVQKKGNLKIRKEKRTGIQSMVNLNSTTKDS